MLIPVKCEVFYLLSVIAIISSYHICLVCSRYLQKVYQRFEAIGLSFDRPIKSYWQMTDDLFNRVLF